MIQLESTVLIVLLCGGSHISNKYFAIVYNNVSAQDRGSFFFNNKLKYTKIAIGVTVRINIYFKLSTELMFLV